MKKVLVLSVLGWSLACGGRRDPEPNSCSFPNKNADIHGLQFASELDPFLAIKDGDDVRISTGGQGSPMLFLTLRIMESDDVDCLSQQTQVINDAGVVIGEVDSPLKTYTYGPNSFTDPIPIILSPMPSPGDALTLKTTAHNLKVKRKVYLGTKDSGDTGL